MQKKKKLAEVFNNHPVVFGLSLLVSGLGSGWFVCKATLVESAHAELEAFPRTKWKEKRKRKV